MVRRRLVLAAVALGLAAAPAGARADSLLELLQFFVRIGAHLGIGFVGE